MSEKEVSTQKLCFSQKKGKKKWLFLKFLMTSFEITLTLSKSRDMSLIMYIL